MKSNSYIRDFFICVVVMLILGAIMSSYCYRQGSKKGFIYGVEYVQQDVIRQWRSPHPLHIGSFEATCIEF